MIFNKFYAFFLKKVKKSIDLKEFLGYTQIVLIN